MLARFEKVACTWTLRVAASTTESTAVIRPLVSWTGEPDAPCAVTFTPAPILYEMDRSGKRIYPR